MRKITKKVTDLGFPRNNSSYITLVRYSVVVTSCFGRESIGDHKITVSQFEEAFIQSELPCSTKVHVVRRHLISLIINNLLFGMGLEVVSEQGTESTHSRFGRVWETRYKCLLFYHFFFEICSSRMHTGKIQSKHVKFSENK